AADRQRGSDRQTIELDVKEGGSARGQELALTLLHLDLHAQTLTRRPCAEAHLDLGPAGKPEPREARILDFLVSTNRHGAQRYLQFLAGHTQFGGDEIADRDLLAGLRWYVCDSRMQGVASRGTDSC